MAQNKPEYKELFFVFGVCSQAFSCLISATGRNKGKLDGEVAASLWVETHTWKEDLYTRAKLTTEAVTFTVIGGKDKSKTFGLNCETSELAQGRKSEPWH